MSFLRRMAGLSPVQAAPAAEPLQKAASPSSKPGVAPGASWNMNPRDVGMGMQLSADIFTRYHPGSQGLDYETLRRLAKIDIISGIHTRRKTQIAEFCQPQRTPYQPGFTINLRDPNKKESRGSKKMAEEISNMLMFGCQEAGYPYPDLESIVRAALEDSLALDQWNCEVLESRGGRPGGILPVDAATMRRAKPSDEALKTGQWRAGQFAYVQWINDEVVAEFPASAMLWGVRRPSTQMSIAGYGNPELAELVSAMTDLLNARTYNSVNFTNGIHASTLLAFNSNMDNRIFEQWAARTSAAMTGPRNAKRLPWIQLSADPGLNEKIQAINMSMSNHDMEYSQWINWLLKIVCAVYLIDPAELNYVFGNEGQTSGLGGGSNFEQRITMSKEIGLRPLMRFVGNMITRVVRMYDEDFTFEFSGMDVLPEETRHKLAMEAVRHFKTINEVRGEYRLEKLDSKIADMVLDPTFISQTMAMEQMAQQQEQGQQPGMPGQDPNQMDQMGQDPAQAGQQQPMPGQPGQDDQDSWMQGWSAPGGGQGGDMDAVTRRIVKAVTEAIADGRVRAPTSLRRGSRLSMASHPEHGKPPIIIEVPA